MSESLFEGFSRFGDRILTGINRNERPACRYKWLLGQINELLKTTHGMVIEKLDRLEKTENIDDARDVLDELRLGDLEESFRVEGMCESFFGLGVALTNLTERGDAFRDDEMTDIVGMARTLANREAKVAEIYVCELQGLTRQRNQIDWQDLPGLKKKAIMTKKMLTDQMSDFDTKAKMFLRLSAL